FFFQAEDGIRDFHVTGVQTCALPIALGIEARAGIAIVVPGTAQVGRGFEHGGAKAEIDEALDLVDAGDARADHDRIKARLGRLRHACRLHAGPPGACLDGVVVPAPVWRRWALGAIPDAPRPVQGWRPPWGRRRERAPSPQTAAEADRPARQVRTCPNG